MIKLGHHLIGPHLPLYIIAEIGVNHNGSLEMAHSLIDEAKKCGVNAVKFQTYITDELVLRSADQAAYQLKNSPESNQYNMLLKYELPFSCFEELKKHCDEISVDFISTAFDPTSLDFVIGLNPVCLKWASGELDNYPLLHQAKQSQLPILISTGMCTFDDIEFVTNWIGRDYPYILLQCVSNYPAKFQDQNLLVLKEYERRFNCPVGFSDHTVGPYASIAARTLGASVLEKHFTLDRTLPGPDHIASSTPKEFSQLVSLIRELELALGTGQKVVLEREHNVQNVARKSLVYRHFLPKGHILEPSDLTSKRPAHGISPRHFDKFIGRSLSSEVFKDQFLSNNDF